MVTLPKRSQAGSSLHDRSSATQLNLSEENFPSLPKSNKLQELNSNGTVNQPPLPCKTSTRLEEKSSIVMKNKDAAIRVNTDKHTGLVTVENPPEWVNEEPSKLENNENSNEYTTEDELEIRDVSQRMSSVRIREQHREVREMPELRPAYPGGPKVQRPPPASSNRRLQELKAQPRSAEEQSSQDGNLAVPVNTPCTPCDSEYSKVNMPNLEKSIRPGDFVEATERVQRARQDLDVTATIRHHRRFFRGSDREIECYKEEQRNDSERLTQQVSFGDVGQCETQEEGFSSRVCVCQFSAENNGESGQRFMQKHEYEHGGNSKDWGERQHVPPVAAGGYSGRPYRGRGRGRGYRGRGRGHRGTRGGFRGNFRGRGDSNGSFINRRPYRESSFPTEELGPPLPRRRRNPRYE